MRLQYAEEIVDRSTGVSVRPRSQNSPDSAQSLFAFIMPGSTVLKLPLQIPPNIYKAPSSKHSSKQDCVGSESTRRFRLVSYVNIIQQPILLCTKLSAV
jgi:hypothetical protein